VNVLLLVLGLVLGVAVGAVLGYFVSRSRVDSRQAQARADAASIIEDANREAETKRREADLAAKEAALKIKDDAEAEVRTRRAEIARVEERLDNRDISLERREGELDERRRRLTQTEEELARKQEELRERQAEHLKVLEEISGLTRAEAERRLFSDLESELESRLGQMVRDMILEAEERAEVEARRLISTTMERLASDLTSESTVKAVSLPSDDMKGRVIGREGRNIRAFEATTGVDVIIDDTPDTVVVSCFDPIRREVARLALEKLVSDGRIHPGRIEEVVNKSRKEVETQIIETGEQAAYNTGVHGLHPELIKLIGRMKWRTSYGQNILQHSQEVAHLAGIMAAELGLDVAMAKRGALLHDVGKVLTHEHEGTHVQLGVEMATKYGEHPLVVNCIAAHHDDEPHESAVSVLEQAADSISGSRPGARREAFETYVKRLEGLERIASSYKGVERVFAIQAGREIRVVVVPDDVDDGRMTTLSEEIARRIEAELQYPGQIKVVLIRETRAVDFAR
jgi:ribonuclease Y